MAMSSDGVESTFGAIRSKSLASRVCHNRVQTGLYSNQIVRVQLLNMDT